MKRPKTIKVAGRKVKFRMVKNLLRIGDSWGTCRHGEVCIDADATGKDLLDTLVHETIHAVVDCRDREQVAVLHEDTVHRLANGITDVLWAHGYRVNHGKKSTK